MTTHWLFEFLGAWLIVSLFLSLALARAMGLSHRSESMPSGSRKTPEVVSAAQSRAHRRSTVSV